MTVNSRSAVDHRDHGSEEYVVLFLVAPVVQVQVLVLDD